MKHLNSTLFALALAAVANVALAQNEQFMPMLCYWVGPVRGRRHGYFRRLHRLPESSSTSAMAASTA